MKFQFSQAWINAIKPETIITEFRRTGIYPLGSFTLLDNIGLPRGIFCYDVEERGKETRGRKG